MPRVLDPQFLVFVGIAAITCTTKSAFTRRSAIKLPLLSMTDSPQKRHDDIQQPNDEQAPTKTATRSGLNEGVHFSLRLSASARCLSASARSASAICRSASSFCLSRSRTAGGVGAVRTRPFSSSASATAGAPKPERPSSASELTNRRVAPHAIATTPTPVPISSPALFPRRRTLTCCGSHPEVVAVRVIYQAIQGGHHTNTEKRFEYCDPNEDTLRSLNVDSNGRARKYVVSGGSEDSAASWEYYYDKQGAVRFVFLKAASVSGSAMEHRVYYGLSSSVSG